MNRVTLFYSSLTEPEILHTIEEEQAYLESRGVTFRTVDVETDEQEAKEAGIRATPAVLVEEDDSSQVFYGHAHGLTGVLKGIIGERSIMFAYGFGHARDHAEDWGLQDADRDTIEERLRTELVEDPVTSLELTALDRGDQTGELRLGFEGAMPDSMIDRLESFLSGVFSAVFDDIVLVEHEGCEGPYCRFTIGITETTDMQEIQDRVKKTLR